MLLLHCLRHNVTRQCLRRYSSARAVSAAKDDPSNAFISYNADARYTLPDAQSLINAGLEDLLSFKPGYQNISLAVKDNICTTDLPTTCASHALEGFQSPSEATVVSLLKQRGVRVVGKTNMDEFGMGSHSTHSHFGPVAQRYTGSDGKEVEYSAGGSSGGSALAVRQAKCTVSLGTDTGGSVRLPAAWCGVVGFKPSYGLVSRWGVIDYANSFDTVGFFGRTVLHVSKIFSKRSTAANPITLTQVADSVSRHDKQDPTSLPPSTTDRIFNGPRGKQENGVHEKQRTIGVPIEYNIAELSPLVKQAWIEALEGCQKMGYKIVPVSLPSTKSALSAYYVLAPAEASSNLAKYDGVRYGNRPEGADGLNGILFSKARAEGFGSEVKRRILLGSYSLSADAIDNYFIQAQKVRRLVQMEFNDVFATPHPLLRTSLESTLDQDYDWESGPGIETNTVSDKVEKVDYILCPTAPTPPPRLEDIAKQTPVESYINDVFTVPASMAGLPAISVPWGNIGGDDPSKNVGLQVIGQFGHDRHVLGVAKRLQDMQKIRGD